MITAADHRNRDGSTEADSQVTQSTCRVPCRHYLALCAALLLAFASTSQTHAQANQASVGSAATQESYDTLLDEAVSAFDASDFARARSLFERAYELRPNARVLRGMGVAALRLERYSEAYRKLTASLKHPVQPLTASQRDEVTGLLSWMETSLSRIKLRWTPEEPAELELLVDGKALKESTVWLAAGTHRIVVRAQGYDAVERTITLAPEQVEVIELTQKKPEPVAVAKPKARRALTPIDAAQSLPAAKHPEPRHGDHMRRDSDPSDGGSVLTRWWFWTAVVAVAAGGVATAVILSQPAPLAPVDTTEGSRPISLISRGLQ